MPEKDEYLFGTRTGEPRRRAPALLVGQAGSGDRGDVRLPACLRRFESAIHGAACALKAGIRMIHACSRYVALRFVPGSPAFRRGMDSLVSRWRESGANVGARLLALTAGARLEAFPITPVHHRLPVRR